MSVKVKCVHCGKLVDEFTNKCPSCGKPVANKYAPTDVPESPSTWKSTSLGKKSYAIYVFVAIAALLIIAVAVYFIVLK